MLTEKEIMEMCIEYAKQSHYIPLIGAVIVNQNKEIVSFGYRQRVASQVALPIYAPFLGERLKSPFQTLHAEQIALEMAGNRAKDSTLYITVEPCVDRRAKPPQPAMPSCTNLIIQKGIARVIFGLFDTNPKLCKRSVPILESYSIIVEQNDFGLRKELERLLVNYQASHFVANNHIQPQELDPRFTGGIKINTRSHDYWESRKRYDRKPAPYKKPKYSNFFEED
jgi:pyrimidine deaminase RibD-like protein